MDTLVEQLHIHADKYKNLLDSECARVQANKRHAQLSCMSDPDTVRVATQVHTVSPGGRLDLAYPLRPDGTTEEYVLYLQGYAVRTCLPPIMNKSQLPKSPERATQSVLMTGLGTEGFEKAVQGALQIYQHMQRCLPAGALIPWKPVTYEGHLGLELSNRYFSSSKEAEGQQIVELSSDIDPNNILRKAVPHGLHTLDNTVVYFERVTDGETK
ncbi:hypothetical protein EIP86_010008 [Pleurotus ostreatoroseus]|nr:hypothetical protein EIP86_010008 [Pleurotus ostreatoroseus]